MKTKIIQIALFLLMSGSALFAQGGCIMMEVAMSATHTRLEPLWFDFDSLDYVNGGITFNYPVGVFTTIPKVQITIVLKNAVYSASETYTPEITAHSTVSTTVRVNKTTVGAITEALTDDVTVYLYALGDTN